MAISDEIAGATRKRQHPKGWEPGVAWDGTAGTLTTQPLEHEPGDALWRDLIADWGLDPATTEVVPGSVQIRAWDANVGAGEIKRLRYYRATIRLREDLADRADVDALCKLALRKKPASTKSHTGGSTFVLLVSDWQLGKGDGGGSEATIERILAAQDSAIRRVTELCKAGRVETVVVACMGDLIEQCSGNYPGQTFTVDLDRREQMQVVRRLLFRLVDILATLGVRVVLAAVPGNHGENRQNGKAFTRITDNDDLAVVEQVAEILSANPERYGHVSTVLADGYNLVLDCSGVNVAFAHGYQSGSGSNAQAKQETWWKGQALGNRPVADAQILITAHYHHFSCSEATGRYWFQTPAMDGGSEWWTEKTGQNSPSGILTMLVGADLGPRPWTELAICS